MTDRTDSQPPSDSPPAAKRTHTVKLSRAEHDRWLRAFQTQRPSTPPPSSTRRSVLPTAHDVRPSPAARRRLPLALAFALAAAACTVGGAALVLRLAARESARWVAPMVLTASDPRVIQVQASLQQETHRRSELALQRTDLALRLAEADAWLHRETVYHARIEAAAKASLVARRRDLQALETELFTENLPDNPLFTTARGADLEEKRATLRQRIRFLQQQRAHGGDAATLAEEVENARRTSEKARALSTDLRRALAENLEAQTQNAALLTTIESSPYRLAACNEVTVGFVPYANRREVVPGAALRACRIGGLFCREVGQVGTSLPGETTHPAVRGGAELRGQLVRLELTEARAAELPTLYARPVATTTAEAGQ